MAEHPNIDPNNVAIGVWEPPKQVSDVEATLQADAASLVNQTDENWNASYAAAKGGANPVNEGADKFADEVLARPATDLIDPTNPEASVERLVTAVDRPGKVRTEEALQARAGSLPKVSANDPAELEWDETQREAGYAYNLFQYHDMPDLDIARLVMEETAEHDANSPWHTFGEVAYEFTPGKGNNDYRALSAAAIAIGALDDNAFNRVFGPIAGGRTQKAVREHINKAGGTPEGRARIAREFQAHLREQLDYFGVENTALARAMLTNEVFTEEFIRTGDTETFWEDLFGNVFGTLSVIELGVVGKGLKLLAHSGRKLPPLFKTVGAANPKRQQMLLQEALNNTPDSVLMKNYGVMRSDLGATQLPRNPLVDDLVDVPAAEMDRLRGIDEGVEQSLKNLRSNTYSVEETATIAEDMAKKIERAHGARIRPGMSKVGFDPDQTYMEFQTVVGKDKAHGFSTQNELLDYAERFEGIDTKFLRQNKDGTVSEFTPQRRYRSSPRGRMGRGNYYVQLNQRHDFSTYDKLLWNDSPVAAGSWLGRLAGAVNVPSSWLRTGIMRRSTNATAGEQFLRQQLDSYLAPVFKLKHKELEQVNGMMMWAQDFGQKNARNPTRAEIKAAFAESPDRAINGYMATRYFNDKLHQINNHTQWSRRKAEGYVTIGRGDSMYHGKEVTAKELKAKRIYDPVTKEGMDVTPELLATMARRRVKIVKLDKVDEIRGSDGIYHYVMADRSRGMGVRSLSYNQLPYIPGYFPRIYADQHYVYKINNKAMIDGAEGRHQETLFTSPTSKEADVRIGKLIDDEGRQLYKGKWDAAADRATKVNLLKKKGVSFEKSQDFRLLDADRTAQDIESFRREGRLFYDQRLDEPLNNIYGEEAAILDPVNTLQRSAQMVSRQVAWEDMFINWKVQFQQHFGPRLGEKMPKIEGRPVSNVLDDLRDLAKQGGEEGTAAREASIFWRYLMQMEGHMGGGADLMRGHAIEASEWLDRSLRNAGGKGLSGQSKDALGRFSLMDMPKKLAFYSLLATRPGRQLPLQALQSLALQSLDFRYAGKWQMDTYSLLLRTKRMGNSKEGLRVKSFKDRISARMLGYTEEETDILVREFEASGLVPQVDIHTYASGIPKEKAQLNSGGIRAMHTVTDPITMVGDLGRKHGFNRGEHINVTASWLMALRRHMKENGFKSPKSLAREDWLEVNNRGLQLALNMNRSNAAIWQHGALGVPLQFLQFTHKWILNTWLNSIPGAQRVGLGNLQIKPWESRKMMAGQLLLFGGAGTVWFEDEVRAIVYGDERLKNVPDNVKDVVAGGLLDKAFDEIGKMLLDPEYDLATGATFSPNHGMRTAAEMYYEGIFEQPLIETLFGPGYQTASRIFTGAKSAHNMAFGGGYDQYKDPNARANQIASDLLSPVAAMIGDVTKANIMLDQGKLINSRGEALDPTGATLDFNIGDWVNRALFGMNSQKIEDAWKAHNNLRDAQERRRQEISDLAKETHRILTATGATPMEELATVSRIAGVVIANWDNDPRFSDMSAMADFQQAYSNFDKEMTLAQRMASAIGNGDVNRDTLLLLKGGTLALRPEDRDNLIEFWNSQTDFSNQYFEETAAAAREMSERDK